jgi:hypothetical protein
MHDGERLELMLPRSWHLRVSPLHDEEVEQVRMKTPYRRTANS